MSKTVLVVAAHTDDEALGCGGTIARHVAEGDTVYAVFLADGVTSRADSEPEHLVIRNEAAEKARTVLGMSKNFYLGLPDNKLDSIPLIDVIQPLEEVISMLMPELIYTHFYGDLNVDHRIAYQAVMTACRPIPDASVNEIRLFEVISSTEWGNGNVSPFVPNVYVNIEAYFEKKIKALNAYSMEMREHPHTRSLEHVRSLSAHRGNCVGLAFAEGFALARKVV